MRDFLPQWVTLAEFVWLRILFRQQTKLLWMLGHISEQEVREVVRVGKEFLV